jgi:UDP-2-acetamido-2,6-beta-L-arabino-hexul-4-ose reductase
MKVIEKTNSNLFTDYRGSLIEIFNQSFLESRGLSFGQIYCLTFSKKGIVRGNHYHLNQHEMFAVLSGTVKIILQDIVTNERYEEDVSADSHNTSIYCFGPKIAHAVVALSDNALLLSHSTKVYDPDDLDKYEYKLVNV